MSRHISVSDVCVCAPLLRRHRQVHQQRRAVGGPDATSHHGDWRKCPHGPAVEVRSPGFSPCDECVTNLSASSDPTENDSITGLRPNARGPGLVTFGPDRVKEFCDANGLQACAAAICLRLTRRPDTHPADDYPSARMCDGRLRALRSRAAHHGILGNQLLWHGQQCGRHPGPRAGLGAFSHLSAQQPYLRISNASANAVPASRPSTVRAPPCAGHILAPG